MIASGQSSGAYIGDYSRLANQGAAMDVAGRQPEIPHQMEKLERTLKGCVEAVEMLGAKLAGTVMRPEVPSNESKDPTALQSTTLGSQLQAMTQVAAQLAARIQSMTARLEV